MLSSDDNSATLALAILPLLIFGACSNDLPAPESGRSSTRNEDSDGATLESSAVVDFRRKLTGNRGMVRASRDTRWKIYSFMQG